MIILTHTSLFNIFMISSNSSLIAIHKAKHTLEMLITNDHKNVNDEETRKKLKTKLIDNNNKKYRLISEKTLIFMLKLLRVLTV